MKNQLIALINRMNEEELATAYDLLKNLIRSEGQIVFFDETANYVKYRSLCSIPQDFLGMGIQWTPSEEYFVEESAGTGINKSRIVSGYTEANQKNQTKTQWEVPTEYNELMEDGFPDSAEDVENMTVLGSDILRKDILSITILNSVKDIPHNHWDVSKEQNKSILAWVVEKGRYKELFLYSAKRIMASNCEGLFAWYMSLSEIHFNHWFYTNDAVSMNQMFMKSVDLSTFNTSQVTDMGYMFYFCRQLTDLNLSSFRTSQVTNMDYMFRECRELTQLNLSSFDFSKVWTMKGMFMGCSKLARINVEPFNRLKKYSIKKYGKDMFTGCEMLSQETKKKFQ